MNPAVLLPMLFLTWQAHSFVPTDYPAKVLPPRDSTVDVYLEFTDGGEIVPLDEQTVRWQVNGSVIAGGTGLKQISFPLNQFTTRKYTVTATVKSYNGQNYEKTVVINRVDPLVALINSGTEFFAQPFFFSSLNPGDYLFNWSLNGVLADNHLASLKLNPPAEPQTFSVGVTAVNRNNEIESAFAKRQFIINQ